MSFKTLLIYPKLGSSDAFITYPPLSLIYTAADAVKAGKDISILDLRFHPNDYLEVLKKNITPDVRLVGISVMTGSPIKYALEISEFLKKNYNVKVVWGGVHPTLLPEQTLENKYIDYIISGYGSRAILELIDFSEGKYSIEKVTNLYYRSKGKVLGTHFPDKHEVILHKDIPYHLVDMEKYFKKTLGERDVPIFTSLGCPYQCTFCVAPVLYKNFKKKCAAFNINDVIDHINLLIAKYSISSLTIFDDDSFLDRDRVRKFLRTLISSGISKKVKINFRGARINELDKMTDEDFDLMVKANVGYIMIGLESGSQRVLNGMKKGFSVRSIRDVNKKFARYPKLQALYNFFVGTPGETKEDLLETKELLLDLLKDNPYCYLGFGSDWKPIPGSEMTYLAEKEYGLKLPAKLIDWAKIDSFDTSDTITYPWYSKDHEKLIRVMQCASGIIDRKLYREFISDKRLFIKLLGILTLMYRPIIIWRIKYSFYDLLIEFPIRNWLINRIFTKF